jgi:hypothetical protein
MSYPIKSLPGSAAERALKVLAGRWKPMILHHLLGSPKHERAVPRGRPDFAVRVAGTHTLDDFASAVRVSSRWGAKRFGGLQ